MYIEYSVTWWDQVSPDSDVSWASESGCVVAKRALPPALELRAGDLVRRTRADVNEYVGPWAFT